MYYKALHKTQLCCIIMKKGENYMDESRNSWEGEKLRKVLRENLRRFRTEADYSQEEVARVLGVNRATYTYYETGKTTPSVVDLYRLAQLYRHRLEEFFQPSPKQ